MKVGQLIEQLARMPSYFNVRVITHNGEFDDVLGVGSAGHCVAVIDVADLEGYNLTPFEPEPEMIAAALEECHVPEALARNVWKAMHAAVDD